MSEESPQVSGSHENFKGDLPRKLQGCLFHFNLEVEVEVGVVWCHTILSQREVRPADIMYQHYYIVQCRWMDKLT